VHEQGTVEVTSGDVTTLAGSFAGVLEGGQTTTEAVDADVSHYKTVRVMTTCFSGGTDGSCGNVSVSVYSIVGNESYLLDEYQMGLVFAQTRTYDVLGDLIAVRLRNDNAQQVTNVGVAVYGRAN